MALLSLNEPTCYREFSGAEAATLREAMMRGFDMHWPSSVLYRGSLQPVIAPVLHEIDEDRIRGHVAHIVGLGPRCEERPDAVRNTVAYLTLRLNELGYSAYSEPCGARLQVNVMAEARGITDPLCVLEFAAHYDTTPNSPGADDNASGLAGLLELARVLARTRLERTIRFCFFGLEELDKSGSRSHVKLLDASPRESVQGTVVYEMIGYRTSLANSQRTPFRFPFVLWPPTTGDFIAVVSNSRSSDLATLFANAAKCYVPDLRVYLLKRLGGYLKDAIRSDHVSYWHSGRKGIMITDTANFRNPNYHQPTDTAETLDYPFICEIVQTSAAMAIEWANRTNAAL